MSATNSSVGRIVAKGKGVCGKDSPVDGKSIYTEIPNMKTCKRDFYVWNTYDIKHENKIVRLSFWQMQ